MDSDSASSADVEAGDFEIKCATSCEFVKKGTAQFAGTSGLGGGGGGDGLGAQVGRGAMAAADALTDLQMKLEGVQEKLKVNPLDKKLISQEKKVKAQITAQTLVLQAAAGGGSMPESPVPQEEAARLAAAQSKVRGHGRRSGVGGVGWGLRSGGGRRAGVVCRVAEIERVRPNRWCGHEPLNHSRSAQKHPLSAGNKRQRDETRTSAA